jgi:hypothetical protein
MITAAVSAQTFHEDRIYCRIIGSSLKLIRSVAGL